jgi:replicative DNA helicase
MAQDPSARRRLSFELEERDFGDQKHRVAFRALRQMARASLDWSEDTFSELAAGGDFGGFPYVRSLLDEYEPQVNLDYHVGRLRLDAAKFELLSEILPATSQACQDPESTASELAHLARRAALRVENVGQRFTRRGRELRETYYSELRMRRLVSGVAEGTRFGPVFDRALTRGFIEGELSLVVGRPSHGKSTWLANFLRARRKAGVRTYVCGWEMKDVDYLDMMVSAETGIPAADLALRVDGFTPDERRLVAEAVDFFTDADFVAIERNPFTRLRKPQSRWDLNERNLDYLEGVVQQECGRYPLFAIDVIGKMLPDRRPDAISEALVRLREMGQGYGVHFMCLHHLNRDAAQGRPTMEGIKGSGGFEEESDIIIALDRPILRASPGKRRKLEDVIDAHLLKQRKGPAPVCTRYKFEGSHYLLSCEVEVDLAMLEKEEGSEEGLM